MESELLLQEGGAHADELMLSMYDPATETWKLDKAGEFWDAVDSAHSLGRRGLGARLAIVDSAFDTGLTALARQQHHGSPSPTRERTAHGTAAALLICEVAPETELHLYPTSRSGKLQLELVIDAINASVDEGIDIINLSLGIGLRATELIEVGTTAKNTYDASGLDMDDWRMSLNIPRSPLWDAARRAVDAGATVVASAGNNDAFVFVPAAVPGVISVAFHTEERHIDSQMEEASSAPPSYPQSVYSDFRLIQPRDVLGSSFASPLVAGFAALVEDRAQIPAHLACVRRAATASVILATLEPGLEPTDPVILAVDKLMKSALVASPHDHYEEGPNSSNCPECAVFASTAYINFALFALNTGNPQIAVQLLLAVRRFAPKNPYAAANLGVAYGSLAMRALERDDVPLAADHLHSASSNMADAVRLRPGYQPYRKRLTEFETALDDPTRWTMA